MSRRKEVLINNGGSEASAEKSLDPKVKEEYEEGLHPKYEGEYLDGLYIKTSVSAIKMKHYEVKSLTSYGDQRQAEKMRKQKPQAS